MKTNLTQAMVTALAMLSDAVAMEAKYPEDLRFGAIYRLYAITPAGLAAITKAEED